jgi:Uma2 family endonuclease
LTAAISAFKLFGMMQICAPPITRYDYEQMPEGPPYFQVIEGELVMSPSPNTFHQHIILNLAVICRRHFETQPVGEVFLAPLDVFLSEINIFQPDLLLISRERLSLLTKQGIEGAPDVVVEILSAGTARYDRSVKRKVYARTGVQELWLVDPETKQMQVYRFAENADTPVETLSAKGIYKCSLFPGLVIEMARVFRRPRGL